MSNDVSRCIPTKVKLAVTTIGYPNNPQENPSKCKSSVKNGVVTDWNQAIVDAGDAVRIVVLDDPGFDDSQGWISKMQNAGQIVFGYTACNGGKDSLQEVRNGKSSPGSGIDDWENSHLHIDGIYLDEGPDPNADSTIQRNYDSYRDYILSKNWHVMMEASQVTEDWITDKAEFIVLWEGTRDQYDDFHGNGDVIPPWWNMRDPDDPNKPRTWTHGSNGTAGADRIIHTIDSFEPESLKSCSSSDWECCPENINDHTKELVKQRFKETIAMAQGRCAGSVDFTDQTRPSPDQSAHIFFKPVKNPAYYQLLVEAVRES